MSHGSASRAVAGLALVALLPASGGLALAGGARIAARSPAAATSQPTPSPGGSVSGGTAPGIGGPAKGDALSRRVLKGILLLLVAFGVVGWLFRARVRSWMIGWTRRG